MEFILFTDEEFEITLGKVKRISKGVKKVVVTFRAIKWQCLS